MPSLRDQIDPRRLPIHIAIIMDGNGRWARQRSLPRIVGHRAGIESAREVVEGCREIGVKVLTLYAFSTENWRRSRTEVAALMRFLRRYLKLELPNLIKNDVRLRAIGDTAALPPEVQNDLRHCMQQTAANKTMTLNLALSYGSRAEIVDAVKRLASDVMANRLKLEEITETVFSQYLDTRGLPDPDLLIRTSGELRLSNFMLWQISYAEIVITPVFWPDFSKEELYKAIIEYQGRERRFGLSEANGPG